MRATPVKTECVRAESFSSMWRGSWGEGGLLEVWAARGDSGSAAEADGGPDAGAGAGGDEFGLGSGKALNEVVRRFTRVRCFVNRGGEHGEGETGIVKDFGTANGGGSENEFHVGEP